MDAFTTAWAKTGREEGGYSDHPADTGGPTMYGITERVARAHGFVGYMRDLPRDVARQIAKAQYWDLMRLDDIAALSPAIAEELFDTGFNAGQATAVKFLQRTLNALNREAALYPDVLVDGLMGRLTIASLRALLSRILRADEIVLTALNGLQAAHYIDITEARPANEQFLLGWLAHRVAT